MWSLVQYLDRLLVAHSTADQGRHDFVNNSSRPKGPNVFYHSSSTNAQNDTGPHQRWATGSLFDNISVEGHDINIRNRGSYGTSHGWAGANMVVWNSSARAFRVQNPPTAQNWLIGSTGPIIEDTTFGTQPSGYYDSHGTPVTVGGVTSLYEAQMNDARDITSFHSKTGIGNWHDANQWAEGVAPVDSYRISLRDYLIGDIDQFTYDGSNSVDNVAIDPSWQSAIASSSALPMAKLDDLSGGKNVAFTMQHTLDPTDQVVHGFLALALKASGTGSVDDDFVRLFDMSPENQLSFAALGWNSQITSSQTFVGVIDLGNDLDQLQSGSVNLQVSNDTGIDWAIYTVAVATARNNSLVNRVYVDGGGTVIVDQPAPPIRQLQVGGISGSTLQLAATASLAVQEDFSLTPDGTLAVEIAGAAPGEFGTLTVANHATLAGTLVIALAAGFEPVAGDTLTLISTGELLGSFDEIELPSLTPGLVWNVDYQPTALVLSTLYAADFNGDGSVDEVDLTHWQLGYGANNAKHVNGDANGDGNVDGRDFLIWQRQFGQSSRHLSPMNVPEPAPLLMLLFAILKVIVGYRRDIHQQ